MGVFVLTCILLVLTLLLVRYARHQGANNLFALSVFLLVITTDFGLMSMLANILPRNTSASDFFTLILYGTLLLLAPLMYCYIETLVYGGRIGRIYKENFKSFLIPLGVLIVNIFGFLILKTAPDTSIFFEITSNFLFYLNFFVFTFGLLLQNLYFLYLSFKLYYFTQPIDKLPAQQRSHKWLWAFLFLYICFLTSLYAHQIVTKGKSDWILLGIELVFMVTVLYHGFSFNESKTGSTIESAVDSPQNEEMNLAIQEVEAYNTNDHQDSPISSALLSAQTSEPIITKELQQAIIEKLEKLLETEKIFKNPDLSLSGLAKAIDTNDKYLRFVISQHYNQSFVNFINQFRVEHARSMLKDPDNQIYTVEAIGQMSGFNSKSAFYTAFKKHTALTPWQFRQQNESENSYNLQNNPL